MSPTEQSAPRTTLRILFVSTILPIVGHAAGDQRLIFLLGELARHHKVDLVTHYLPVSASQFDSHARPLVAAGVNVLPWQWRAVHAAAFGNTYDVVVFEFWTAGREFVGLFRQAQPWAKLVVDTVDVHFAREEAATDGAYGTPAEVADRKRQEIDLCNQCDANWVVTDLDRQLLIEAGGRSPMPIIPVVVEPRERPPGPRSPGLLFVGSFGHPPNPDAIKWMLADIWPRIRSARPSANLTIIGSRPTPDVLALNGTDGITVLADCPDVGPYLDAAAVSVAPLRYGAGMKGKVTGAMACGVPVVTTSVGTQGLPVQSGTELLVADDAQTFSASILNLLDNPAWAEQVGVAGKSCILKICGPSAVSASLERAIAQLGPGSAPVRRPLHLRALAAAHSFKVFIRWLTIGSARPSTHASTQESA